MPQTPDDPTKAQAWVTKNGDDLDFEFYFPQGPKGDPGGFTTATGLSSSNLNEIIVPGHYVQTSTPNATLLRNYPWEGAIGILEVFQRHSTAGIQRMTTAKGVYLRRFETGTPPVWFPWVFYPSQRVDQAAGRAIYTWDDLNNREQLVYGDTGWRQVAQEAINGWAVGALLIRRIGSSVFLKAYNLNSSAATADGLYAIPSGFKTSVSGSSFVVPNTTSSSMHLQVTSTGNLTVTGRNGSTYCSFQYIEVSWATTEAWPTTLPGAAVGSVPNL